jgi:VIT1/CCC1 family predicted Fe2+/Mn2+ transporter
MKPSLQSIQTEIDASYLYGVLADKEEDAVIAGVFRQMSEIERGHAEAFLRKHQPEGELLLPPPSMRAKTLNRIGKWFGYEYVLGVLMDTEKSISGAVISAKAKHNKPINGSETNHVRILRSILDSSNGLSGASLARFEKRHRSVGGNALRAAVLGGNDGLVSNFSLVMGVAGATHGGSNVLLAGSAGMLAGALSMALGEWISVKSSQELYENQMDLEMEELETNPEGEIREIALIYIAKGIPEEQAHTMAREILSDTSRAHEFLVREELGINPEELKGSAMEAALYSFFLFSIGAIIPLFPFFFTEGYSAILLSVAASSVGLFFIGASITLFTGRSMWKSGMRQVLFGLAAAAITFAVGQLLGVTVGG